MFAKVDVNGSDAHPLFAWLRKERSGLAGDRIKWNFTKFLIGRDGKPVKRYASATKPGQDRRRHRGRPQGLSRRRNAPAPSTATPGGSRATRPRSEVTTVSAGSSP